MKKTDSRYTDLLALLVFGLFALCLLLVLLTGARVYKNLVTLGQDSHRGTTQVQYLSTRVRQGQDIQVSQFGGCTALMLTEELDGECYVTYVYCYEGWLRELFCLEGASLTPEDGEKVLEADSLELSLEDGLLTARIDGQNLSLHLRTGRTVTP